MHHFAGFLAIFLVTAVVLPNISGQVPGVELADETLDQDSRKAIVDNLNRILQDKYIFPEMALTLKTTLTANLESGKYANETRAVGFAAALSQDLLAISHDRHFYFGFEPDRAKQVIQMKSQSPEDSAAARAEMAEMSRQQNFGVARVERLSGNIGYLDLRFFDSPDIAADTVAAAMNVIANSNAVIIDLRENHGGDPSMVQFICSYFFDERTHLNSFVYREKPEEQYWTIPHVPGKKMVDMDLYVLTSGSTGSGAEEFTYNMKNLKRGTIIGETTVGAAHPIEYEVILDKYVLHLPQGRPVNPVSKTNWEGTGVTPDIAVPQADALTTAHILALETLLKQGQTTHMEFVLNWAMDALNADRHPVTLDKKRLKQYAGAYSDIRVLLEKDGLVYERRGTRYPLHPMTESLFRVGDFDNYRIAFNTDENGNVTELVRMFDDGFRMVINKNR